LTPGRWAAEPAARLNYLQSLGESEESTPDEPPTLPLARVQEKGDDSAIIEARLRLASGREETCDLRKVLEVVHKELHTLIMGTFLSVPLGFIEIGVESLP